MLLNFATRWREGVGLRLVLSAPLKGLYHRPVSLDPVLWIPALIYCAWVHGLLISAVPLVTAADRLRAVFLAGCQVMILLLVILTADGVLGITKSRWRIVFVALAHLFLASLYLDGMLYRFISLHIPAALGILFQGGVRGLAINWQHTGIPTATIGIYVCWSLGVVATIVFYAWLMAAPNRRLWRARTVWRVSLGRLALATCLPAIIGQMLSSSDDHNSQFALSELKKALPVYFGEADTRTGRRIVVPALRPLRAEGENADALRLLDLQAGVHPDIFLFVLESARADFVTAEIAPQLTALREESLPFPRGLAAANGSHVSWYSLLTANHGLYFGAEKRKPIHTGSVPLQLFRRLGYRVHVLCSSTLDYHGVDRMAFGSDLQLCDSMFDAQKAGVGDAPSRDCAVTERLLSLLDQPAGNRLFLVFYHSTHHDYDWPAGDRTPFAPYADSWNYADFNISQAQLQLIVNRYRNAFHFQDDLVGQILARLKEKSVYEESIIAVTGDHGEEFLEHGKLLHASNLFRPQTAVPFILKPQDSLERPSHGEPFPTATHVDLLPSLLDLTGVITTNLFDGESLFHKTADRAIIVAENRDWDPVGFCLQSERFKVFFEYEHARKPTSLQHVIYLRQITDLDDVPIHPNLFDPAAFALIQTNFATVLQSIYPGSSW